LDVGVDAFPGEKANDTVLATHGVSYDRAALERALS
jgi:hypothetical protein